MKKISILFLLLMGLFLPWAANAQEQNMLNGDAADNGGRGTMRIYKKVSSLNSGKNYLIVSSQTANSNAYALSQTSSSLTSSSVHINAGDQFCSTVYINSEGLEPTAVWKANSGWTFSHSKNGTNFNITTERSGFISYSYSLTVSSSSSTSWTYSNNSLSFSGNTGWFSTGTFYITPSGSTFTLGTSSANVYLYEETDLTVFDITATVSPSGIGGTVTGAGRYLSGAQCELTATTNNSEYAFVNWTNENGSEFSTANPCSFTVRADQNLVAHFESTVDCLAPTDAAVINQSITAHTAALNWTENGEASQWQVVYSTDANFDPNSATPTLVSNNPYTITGLAQSTTYYAYVRAYCDANHQSAWSNQVTFSTIAGNQPPTNLTLGTPEPHGITLSWTGVTTNTNHQNFEVYYSTSSVVPSADIASGYEIVNTNSCTLSGLIPETTYYAWVRDNCDTDGKSAWVAFNPFTTGIACFAPTSLTASNGSVTARTATLTWSENGSATNWVVEYATNSSFTEALTQEVNTNPTTQLTGLTPETTYFARVKAICGGIDGESSYSNTVSFTTEVACPTPTNLATTNGSVTSHTATLTWAENGSATNWVVEYTTNSSFAEALTQEVNTNPTTQLTDLVPETTYFARVKAICGGINGESLYSNTVSFTTGIACFAPTNLTASNVTNNTAVISWTGEAEIFNLRYGTIEGFRYGFEDAEPWNYTNFSPCTVYDGDGGETYGFQDTEFPNSGYTGACIAFQNGLTDNLSAHSGNAFGIMVNARPNTIQNGTTTNDWFILPQITIENGDVFSFWAREITNQYGAEVINVGVCGSSQGTFSAYLAQNLNVSTTSWTNYSYDLSAYAGQTIRLAINCVSNDIFGFMFDDIFVGNPNPAWSEPITGVTSPYTLTGLDYTDYEVQVQGNCGSFDGLSQWSSTTFQTLDDCTVPFSLNYTDATCIGSTLSWEGVQESYNVRYHNVITPAAETEVSYNFNSNAQSWTTIDADGYGDAWSHQSSGGHSGGCMRAKYNSSNAHQDYLVSPQVTLGGTLSFYAKRQNTTYNDCFRVYLSTSGNTNASDFTIELTHGDVTPSNSYTQYIYDLSNYSGMGYIAIVYTAPADQYYLFVDDINISGLIPATYGPLVTESNVTSPLEVTGLMPTTNYEWQVQGVDCDGNGGTTEWSEVATFTTLPAYKKTIEPYEGDGGYYLIASPLASAVNPATVGMITDELGAGATAETSTYDFYFFDQTNNKEWNNYREAPFNMENGKGYLYANKGGITLTFADTPYSGNGQVELVYSDVNDDENMRGWNLVGNPFAQTAYIDMPFYTLNGDAEFVENEAGTPIEAMQGILVYTNANATLTFSTEPAANRANLALSLSKDRAVIDRAILSFNESSQLPKFQLRESSTMVYIPQDGKDYSVVNAANVDNMPVNFKAETNGTYTFSFNAEEVDFAYLHLIDHINGNDVDLLATPSYSFEAKTTDRENRFKLVFATGGNSDDDNFAFYSNGSFVINNEGEATLQVIDINGRILRSESINGCANINVNAAQGIYMLRLMNGENVKVQKMVVR